MNSMTPEELEKFIHENLRELPPRRAPRTLESRVLAALERDAMLPWYHRSWSHWPATVRSAFLVVALAVAAAVLLGFYLGLDRVADTAAVVRASAPVSLLTQVYHAGRWVADFASQIADHIPPLWLYGAIAVVAGLYATFFGLGAAAYRTLYRQK